MIILKKNIPLSRLWLLLFIPFLFLVGCTSSNIELNEYGKGVVLLHHPEKYPGCIAIDSVNTTAVLAANNSYQQAMNKMRNTAAALGVTHLTIDQAETRTLVTTIEARGFKCVHLSTTQEASPVTPDSWIFVD